MMEQMDPSETLETFPVPVVEGSDVEFDYVLSKLLVVSFWDKMENGRKVGEQDAAGRFVFQDAHADRPWAKGLEDCLETIHEELLEQPR